MSLATVALVLLQGEPGAAPPVWAGSPEEGLARVSALAASGEEAAATELAAALAADAGTSERLRAEAQYALGWLSAEAEDVLAADAAYGAARALAGPGELRLAAAYNAGVAWLEDGERWRARIPEIAQAGGQGPGGAAPVPFPGAAGPSAAPAAEEPDPLESARRSYRTARERLVDRLRSGWRDADTRANLELVQRRLAELDDIEEQRRQQQQEQQQQEPQDQGESPEDPPPSEDQPQDGESEDAPEDGESQEDPGSQPPDAEEEPAEEQPEEQDPSGAEEEPEPPGPDDPGDPHEPEELEGEPGSEPQEVHLSREEAQRLLDRLSEIEEAAEALRARLREARRVPVPRDW